VRRLARFVTGLAVVTAALVSAAPAAAQVTEGPQTNKYLELLRQDLRTKKTALVTEAMDLTDAQAAVFWPIYDEYSREMRAVWDGRIANITLYAENYERMTNEMAKQIADKVFKLDELPERTLELAKRIAQLPTMTALLMKESVNQTVDNMGFYNALNACFTLHQLNHSHWAEVRDDGIPLGDEDHGIPNWKDAPPVVLAVKDQVRADA